MANETDDGGPAFPCAGLNNLPNGQFLYGNNGMSFRDAAALVAMHAIITKSPFGQATDDSCKVFSNTALGAYEYADAMLKERKS